MADPTHAHRQQGLETSYWRQDQARTDRARRVVADVLAGDSASRNLTRYYTVESNYAGATFTGLRPNDPDCIDPVDLLAVTTLSVQIPPLAIRRFTSPETSAELSGLLGQLDPGLRLQDPEARDAAPVMGQFYELVKATLRRAGVQSSNPWVTASKICARKRPNLFPVRDSVVVKLLGLKGNYPDDWPVFAALVAD